MIQLVTPAWLVAYIVLSKYGLAYRLDCLFTSIRKLYQFYHAALSKSNSYSM